MKRLMTVLIAVVLLGSVGCSRFSFSTGLGFRSVPPTLPNPIIHQLEAARAARLSPVYIDFILKLLANGALEGLIIPKNRTDIGWWMDILAES